MEKCKVPEGISYEAAGIEIDPCRYRTTEVHHNVTVEVITCSVCGHTEISWYRQEDTVSEYFDKEE